MANIGLISFDSTSSFMTTFRDALTALGHTVTVVLQANVGTHDFAPYDLVATSRTDRTTTEGLQTADLLSSTLNSLNASGKPLLIGLMERSTTSTAHAGTTTVMGLTGQVAVATNQNTLKVLPNTGYITKTIAPETQTLYFSTTYMAHISVGEPTLGTVFGVGASGSPLDRPMFISIPSGTPRLTSGSTGARIVLADTYLSGTVQPVLREIYGRSIEWLLNQEVTYSGEWSSKFVGYAVQDLKPDVLATSKFVAYAVLDIEHAEVYTSKFIAYAVTPNVPFGSDLYTNLDLYQDEQAKRPTLKTILGKPMIDMEGKSLKIGPNLQGSFRLITLGPDGTFNLFTFSANGSATTIPDPGNWNQIAIVKSTATQAEIDQIKAIMLTRMGP